MNESALHEQKISNIDFCAITTEICFT